MLKYSRIISPMNVDLCCSFFQITCFQVLTSEYKFLSKWKILSSTPMFTTQTLIWHGNRVGHTYTLINANNIDLPPKKTNKSRDELNIVFVRKSWLISQHGSQILKTCNLKKWTTKINVHRRCSLFLVLSLNMSS
jgi:hypothetical protein